MASKQRLDLELVARGLVASRQQAQQLIRAGLVRRGFLKGVALQRRCTRATD
jgi:23S rRNA (cytidine1920-2'-O)/16S rRNA (cytidine1409-2'-O)-methyltransferase